VAGWKEQQTNREVWEGPECTQVPVLPIYLCCVTHFGILSRHMATCTIETFWTTYLLTQYGSYTTVRTLKLVMWQLLN